MRTKKLWRGLWVGAPFEPTSQILQKGAAEKSPAAEWPTSKATDLLRSGGGKTTSSQDSEAGRGLGGSRGGGVALPPRGLRKQPLRPFGGRRGACEGMPSLAHFDLQLRTR